MMPGLVRGVLELVIQYAFGSRDRNVSKRIQPHNSNSMKGVTLRLSNAESPQTRRKAMAKLNPYPQCSQGETYE
jgi:hypothetical protein